MAKTKTSFKKGQAGNPKGRKPLPPELREARAMSYENMCRTVVEVQGMTPEEIRKIDMDKIPLGKRAILNAYAKLDYRGIKEYEDRLWGKAKDNVELSTGENSEITVNINGIDATFKNKLQS